MVSGACSSRSSTARDQQRHCGERRRRRGEPSLRHGQLRSLHRARALYGSRDKVVPTASFGTVFNDPRSRTIETQGTSTLSTNARSSAGWQLGSRLNYNRYLLRRRLRLRPFGDDATPLPIVNKDFARGDWWGTELKVTRKLAHRQTLALGSEYRDNIRQDQYNYDEGTAFSTSTIDATVEELGTLRAGRDRAAPTSCWSTSGCATITTTPSAAPPTRASA